MSATLDNVEVWSGKDRGDENFPVGSLLIAKNLRAHVHAFYAFARNADDIADSPTLVHEDKISRLDIMEDVLLGRRDHGSPSACALRDSLRETGVTAQHSSDLLVAFRRDATKLRYQSWAELLDYCRYSAMPVGRHVLDLHDEPPNTYKPSDGLCSSLQILNHIQDCAKDLSDLDRCYLPIDLMEENGAVIDDLRAAHTTPGMRLVFDSLLLRCKELNAAAWDLPRRTRNRRLRVETAVIAGMARTLHRRLMNRDPLATRVKLAKFDVLANVIGALRFLA